MMFETTNTEQITGVKYEKYPPELKEKEKVVTDEDEERLATPFNVVHVPPPA